MATVAIAERQSHLPGLVWTLVRTDFKSRYHGTAGGFLWALLRPLFMFVVLMSVFSFIFASQPRYRLDLIIGLFLWDFFAEGTKVGLMSLHSKAFLLTKARFPAWLVVLASSSNAVITFVAFAIALAGYLAMSGLLPGPAALAWFAWYALLLWLIVTGMSLASSVLFLRFRDLNQVWDVICQAGFFVAPIIYPLNILPERFHFFLYVWPPTPVIQFSRGVLTGDGPPTLRANLMLAGVTGLVLAVGAVVFRTQQARAIEQL
jgi:lipopolysaccharide transport system permease protein